jgi:hypothetical protein
MFDLLKLKARNGVPFVAQIIREGDSYGADNCLILSKEELIDENFPALIEFYDARHPFDFDKDGIRSIGQFVSRYYADTLIHDDSNGRHVDRSGLNLDDGTMDWTIDADTMFLFRHWIRDNLDNDVPNPNRARCHLA